MRIAVFVFVVAALLVAMGVSAQEEVGLRGSALVGLAFPRGDVGDYLDSGLALHFDLSGPLADQLRWRGEVGWNRFDIDDEGYCDLVNVSCGGPSLLHFLGGVEYDWYGDWSPYVFGMIGFYRVDPGDFIGNAANQKTDTELGYALGGGLRHQMGESWGLFGEVRVDWVAFDDDSSLANDTENALGVGFGVSVNF